MRLMIVTPEVKGTVEHVTAGDMVWLQMNRRKLSEAALRQRFPDARFEPNTGTTGSQRITGIILDDPEACDADRGN